MAHSGASLLAHANSTAAAIHLQIPPINIKLDRENYSLWRSTVISALETFDLESFIFNPSPPAETYVSSDSDDDDAAPAPKPNPAYALWKRKDRARRMAMKVQLQTLSKGSLSMLEYIERKRAIADSLAENLNPIPDEDLIGYLLSGLDSSYAAFTTAFMMKSDAISVDDLVGFLLQEEARIEHEHNRQVPILPSPTTPASPISATAFAAHRSSPKSSQSFHNYNTASPNRPTDPRRRRPMCQLCNHPGHEAIDCYQRNNQTDYPSRRPNPRNSSRQANLAQAATSSTVMDPAWYFDTGATDHVTPDLRKLNLADEYSGTDKLQVGNGQNSTPGGHSSRSVSGPTHPH